MTPDGNGGIFVAGFTSESIDGETNNGAGDGFIAHYDSAGNKTWTQLIGSPSYDYIYGVTTEGNGGVFVAGFTVGSIDGQTNNGDGDVFVVKFSTVDEVKDSTPPTLKSTTATSNQLILKFSEDIQIAGGGTLNPAYMTVTVDGQTRKITRSQITAPDHPSIHTASQLALTLSGRSLDRASSISISYNPPSNTTTSGFITDLAGNKLAAITSQAIDTFSTSTSILRRGIASAYKNLILTGIAPVTGYGNAQDNTITGNDANNILDGLAGADTMLGGLGDDTYVVDNIGDLITELGTAGTDTVQSSISYTLADNLENLTLLGSAAINGTGNSGSNILTGNTAANVLNGNGGADTLIGGRGNDTYIVDSTDDTITETGTSSDIDSIQASVSWVLGLNLENLTLTGTSVINGTGNERDNAISGNSANNILDGGNGGTDRLTGLGGADMFRFSTRPTSFRDSSADHITDFSSTQGDKIQISKSAFGITASTATLSVVSSAAAVTTALSTASLFVYNTANGELHWNQNGITRGAGAGGVLAILDNRSTLSAGDLILV
jgi:Ca2+-binding RTX toxin-like protein